MRLTELRPKIEDTADPKAKYLHFDCPHCRAPLISIKIADGPSLTLNLNVWRWNGETDFTKLSLDQPIEVAGHWKGTVKDGVVSA